MASRRGPLGLLRNLRVYTVFACGFGPSFGMVGRGAKRVVEASKQEVE